jgi:hypothetical protein
VVGGVTLRASSLLAEPSLAEGLARRFHETYERLAPHFNYETRPESAVAWEDVPEANRRLMVATCEAIFDEVRRHVLTAAERDLKPAPGKPCALCGQDVPGERVGEG